MSHSSRSDCPISLSLEIFGDRWTLLILRDIILFDKTHFREFAKKEGIASNVLSQRLNQLVDNEILLKQKDPNKKSSNIYKLTKKGVSLVPVMVEILDWGLNHTKGKTPNNDFQKRLLKNKPQAILGLMDALREKIEYE